MTKEKVEIADKLISEIKKYSDILHIWENATNFSNNIVLLNCIDYSNYKSAIYSPETFDVVKFMNISYFNLKVINLQKQFDEL